MSINISMDLRVTVVVQIWTGLCFPPGEEQMFTPIQADQGPFLGHYMGTSDTTDATSALLRLRESIVHAMTATFAYTAPVQVWTRDRREIAVDHGIDLTSADAVGTLIMVCNRYINIEAVDEYKAEMDRKIDRCIKTVAALRDFFSESEHKAIGLCSISYRFEQDEDEAER